MAQLKSGSTVNGVAIATLDDTNDIIEMVNRGKSVDRTIVIGTTASGHTSADCDYLCDGTADEVEINAAIGTIGTGERVEIFFLPGTYNLAATVNFNKEYMVINAKVGTLESKTVTLSYSNFQLTVGANNVTIKNVRFYENFYDSTCFECLNNNTYENLTFIACMFHGGYNWTFNVNANKTLVYACHFTNEGYNNGCMLYGDDNKIIGCKAYQAGNNGFSVSGHRVLIDSCVSIDCYYGVDVGWISSGVPSEEITIVNSFLAGSVDCSSVNGLSISNCHLTEEGVSLVDVNQATFGNNVLMDVDTYDYTFSAKRCTQLVIDGNSFVFGGNSTSDRAFYLQGNDGLIISNNTIYGSGHGVYISRDGTVGDFNKNVVIADNIFKNQLGSSIHVYDYCDGLLVSDNKFEGTPTGLFIDGSGITQNVKVSGNQFNGCTVHGMYLEYAYGYDVSNNQFIDCDVLIDDALFLNFTGNHVKSNTDYGVKFGAGGKVNFTGNSVYRTTGVSGSYTASQYSLWIAEATGDFLVSGNCFWGKNYVNDGGAGTVTAANNVT